MERDQYAVFLLGLIGLFFNKTVLKVILFIVAAYLLLQVLAWFLSFSAGLGWAPLICLVAATLILSSSPAIRNSHLGSIIGSVTFLLFSFLSFVLILEILVPVQIAYPMSIPIKLAIASLPSIMYFTYRRNEWSPKKISFFHRKLRHNTRISPSDLLPKGIEEGHIVYKAGSRGFRVLKFIEVKQRLDGKEDSVTSEQIRRPTVVTLTNQLSTLRKLGIEISYELYCRSGVQRTFIASISEGRDYSRCRSLVDEYSSSFSRNTGSFGSATASIDSSGDCSKAKRILMFPIFTDVEEITEIKNTDYDINLFKSRDPKKPTRLRMIHLSNTRLLCLNSKYGLIGELAKIALTQRPAMDFACILHIRPLPEDRTDRELAEMSKNHSTALARVTEELKNEFMIESGQTRKPRNYQRDRISNAQQEARKTSLEIERLQNAKKSGYFEVNLTIISEPATVESIARKIKVDALGDVASAELSIDRVPPQLIVETLRRHPLLSSDKLTGEEIVSLVRFSRGLSQNQTKPAATEENGSALTRLPIGIVPNPAKP
jgi:hypothetical protein